MVCKLCQNDTCLCESHIIPETFYEGIYDEKNRAVAIPSKERAELVQNGDYEKLLCQKCEQKFSKWEKILKSHLVEIAARKDDRLKFALIDQNSFEVKNIKYKEFKLGVLSIFWRISVASNTNFKLREHEELLRKILINEESLAESKYPITVERCEFSGHFDPNLVGYVSTENNNPMLENASFVIWGHYFTVFLDDTIFFRMPKFFLRNSGDLVVLSYNFDELDFATGSLLRLFDNDVKKLYNKLSK